MQYDVLKLLSLGVAMIVEKACLVDDHLEHLATQYLDININIVTLRKREPLLSLSTL